MTPQQQSQLIEGYFEGTLTTDQKKQFKELRRHDPDFAKEAKIYQKIEHGFKGLHLEHLQHQMNNWESGQKDTKVVELPARGSWVKYMSIAAAIAIMIATPFIYQNMNSNPYEQYFQANADYANDLVSLRGSNSVTSNDIELKNQGFLAYRQNDYPTAIVLLEDYTQRATDDYQAQLVLGIAALAVSDENTAINQFDNILRSNDANTKQDAQWFWALAQYKAKNTAASKKMLTKIIASTTHIHYQEAKDFLNAID